MNTVRFYDECPADVSIKYAVIVAQYHGKWILCRHKDRKTWEIPGGHREMNEKPEQTAARELWEETGALKAKISPVCAYSFCDYGMLYYADVPELGSIPDGSEIAETGCFARLPDELTYPHIQPALFEKVQSWLKNR